MRTGSPYVQLVDPEDPRLVPVLDDLHRDYVARYPRFDVASEMTGYPRSDFVPPYGAFLLLLDGEEVVAAGAYRRFDERTAELKRVWTSGLRRREGLGRRIVTELEEHAAANGYEAIHLTTGPCQPEARALYLALGYTAVGDHDAVIARQNAPLVFTKEL